MSSSSPLATQPIADAVPRQGTDRRRHKRIGVNLLGRFMRESRHEYPCRLVDVSVGGAAVISPVVVNMGERIVAYVDQLGGIEGHVTRIYDGGFAFKFNITAHKREKLAAQLTWIINRDLVAGIDQRRHERHVVADKVTLLELPDGAASECRILDVSLSGASLETAARPMLGSLITLGKLRARVMRHHENGIGVEFLDIQEPEALRRHFT